MTEARMRLVVLESPYSAPDAAGVAFNVNYARACLADCLSRGEAAMVSHLLYPGTLDDDVEAERALGLAAGLAWLRVAEASVVYIDLGVTPGMRQGIDAAVAAGLPIEFRTLRNDRPVPSDVTLVGRAAGHG